MKTMIKGIAKGVFNRSSMFMKTSMMKGARALGSGSKMLSKTVERGTKTASEYAKSSGGWENVAKNVAETTMNATKSSVVGQLGMTAGKLAVHTGRGFTGLGKIALKNPTKVGISAGLIGGVTSYNINNTQRIMEDYRRRKETGMKANHLGTDGLTLSLSRTRHGNNVRRK